jgi:hypothetical protein
LRRFEIDPADQFQPITRQSSLQAKASSHDSFSSMPERKMVYDISLPDF